MLCNKIDKTIFVFEKNKDGLFFLRPLTSNIRSFRLGKFVSFYMCIHNSKNNNQNYD
jgi:hypothetical protein